MIRLALPLLVAAALAAAPALAQTRAAPESREQIRLSFAPLVKKSAPAVVNVYTKRRVQGPEIASPLFNDPFFRRFFGEQFGLGMPRQRVEQSLGSGVIVGSDGVVVTNHHVIKGSEQITVILNDRREFEAVLVGSDERTDLAVLRIQPKGERLPALEWGDSDSLQVGDLVLAIGNPFGVGQTVTSGIVSALARTSVGVSDFQFFIQTDAAINPGNSGGALVAQDGTLVGINTAIYSGNGGSVGIGFAIPSAMVRAVVASVLKHGKVVRGWLGATSQTVTADLAQQLGLARPMGALVNRVHPNSPADRAGIRAGDILVAINGKEIEDEEALRFRIAALPMGESATLQILSKGKAREAVFALVPPPEDPPTDAHEVGGRNPLAGTTVANLNPALMEEIGLHGEETGVIVLRIQRGGLADRVGLQPGDVLVKINDKPIARVEDLKRILTQPVPRWTVSIKRGGRLLSFQVAG